MAAPAPTDDPIRTEVERRLTALADAIVARPLDRVVRVGARLGAPCREVRTRLALPLAVIRTVAELALGRATGRAVHTTTPDPDVLSSPLDAPLPDGPSAAVEDASIDDLPIDEYESLAASQVVARLDGMSDVDLDRVRTFEAAHRGRRTVLGKIDQLRSDR